MKRHYFRSNNFCTVSHVGLLIVWIWYFTWHGWKFLCFLPRPLSVINMIKKSLKCKYWNVYLVVRCKNLQNIECSSLRTQFFESFVTLIPNASLLPDAGKIKRHAAIFSANYALFCLYKTSAFTKNIHGRTLKKLTNEGQIIFTSITSNIQSLTASSTRNLQ